MHSFDAVACIPRSGRGFKGLRAHSGSFPHEPGPINGIVTLHPPPPGLARLAIGVSFYRNQSAELWRRMARSALSRWSTSPDIDLRTSPLLSLGAQLPPRRLGLPAWAVLGGPFWPRSEVEAWKDDQLEKHLGQLDPYLRATVPPRPPFQRAAPSVEAFLQERCGVVPVTSLAQVSRGREGAREAAVACLARGLMIEGAREHFEYRLALDATRMVAKAHLFDAPEKVRLWIRMQGRKKRARIGVLKACGLHHKRRAGKKCQGKQCKKVKGKTGKRKAKATAGKGRA